jgi:hypothetical protein
MEVKTCSFLVFFHRRSDASSAWGCVVWGVFGFFFGPKINQNCFQNSVGILTVFVFSWQCRFMSFRYHFSSLLLSFFSSSVSSLLLLSSFSCLFLHRKINRPFFALCLWLLLRGGGQWLHLSSELQTRKQCICGGTEVVKGGSGT